VKAEIPFESSEKAFLGCYQRAVTTVENNMSSEVKKEVEELAELWNREGAPPDAKLK
jgi:hypothetical protein